MNSDKIAVKNPNLYIKKLYNYLTEIDSQGNLDFFRISLDLKKIYSQLSTSPKELIYENLEALINNFSVCDHLFFDKVLSRLTSEESHMLMINAISNFGYYLSQSFMETQDDQKDNKLLDNSLDKARIIFVIKGGFSLAHMSIVKSIIYGHVQAESKRLSPYFCFLDQQPPDGLQKISFDLSKLSTFEKLHKYREIIYKNNIGSMLWSSVPQLSSLFFGSRFTIQQIFWSARYKNPLGMNVNKYFFGARNKKLEIQHNGATWLHVRAHVGEWQNTDLINFNSPLISDSDKDLVNFAKEKHSKGLLVVATISTARKLMDQDFHHCIANLLAKNNNIFYIYTSRNQNCELNNVLKSYGLNHRFKQIPWINHMSPVLKNFDLILDSFPVGASYSLCYAVCASTPFISLITQQNRSSSLLETLGPIIDELNINYSAVGFLKNKQLYFTAAQQLCSSSGENDRKYLLANQQKLLNTSLNNPVDMYNDFSDYILS